MSLQRVRVTRYVTPLREGGSLPGIVEGDDLGTWVCKFIGAGQGKRVLVAEIIVAGLARALEIPTPGQCVLDLDPRIARYEADEEVQDLLNASPGLNLGIDFLPGSFGFDASTEVEGTLAAKILWLDALSANVDRSWRNPNMIEWNGAIYAIDHGASLYFHHSWPGGAGDPARFARQAYDISEHVLMASATASASLDAELAAKLTVQVLEAIVADVPDEWLDDYEWAENPAAVRQRYVDFLTARLEGDRLWVPGKAS